MDWVKLLLIGGLATGPAVIVGAVAETLSDGRIASHFAALLLSGGVTVLTLFAVMYILWLMNAKPALQAEA